MQSPIVLRLVLIGSAAILLLACDISTLLPSASARPTVVVQFPASGSSFREGEDVPIQSASSDSTGIVRVELIVDGQLVSSDAPPIPQGQISFSLVQRWKASSGSHTISVRAYNAAGRGSDPASVSVEVSPVQQTALGSPTPASVNTPTPAPIASPPGAQPTNTSGAISAQPTATRRPNTPTPTRAVAAASPTISAPPGVYALSIRLEPANPKASDQIIFYVTFLNTTGSTQHYRWYVRYFRPDNSRNSFGETSNRKEDDFPVGRFELASLPSPKYGVTADCQPLFARVFWIDPDNVIPTTEFLKTDGQQVNQGFSVCP